MSSRCFKKDSELKNSEMNDSESSSVNDDNRSCIISSMTKNSRVISLGAACDISMVMDRLHLRTESYPFDWLWNLDYGLAAVIDMIDTDFAKIEHNNAYDLKYHYRVGRPMIVYKEYPSIIHMHSDPMNNEDDHKTILRRIARFREAIFSADHLNFIYYKNFFEEKLRDQDISLADTVHKMKNDSLRFVKIMDRLRPNSTFSLMLVLQTNPPDEYQAYNIIKQQILEDDRINFEFTITRNDEDQAQNEIWFRQWRSAIARFYSSGKVKNFALECKI